MFFFLAPSILCWKGVRITYLDLKLCAVFLITVPVLPRHYCTNAITVPVKGANEEDVAFLGHMIEWDSHNHMILTWIWNTFIPSISNLLGNFDDAKSAWDILAKRYSTTHGSMKYQLMVELHQLRQEPGQSINDYYDQLRFIWDQIDLSDPT